MSASMFPARAGMSLGNAGKRGRVIHVPRASGDEPNELTAVMGNARCSPRERG